MWQCPECNRKFSKQNQKHSCGEFPKTIEMYIEEQPEEIRPLLYQVRDTIRAALPEAEERISWKMPTFWKRINIIHFAAFKNHLGIYPGDKAVEHFADRLSEYKTSKGAIQFQYSKKVPFELIAEIAKWCYDTGNRS